MVVVAAAAVVVKAAALARGVTSVATNGRRRGGLQRKTVLLCGSLSAARGPLATRHSLMKKFHDLGCRVLDAQILLAFGWVLEDGSNDTFSCGIYCRGGIVAVREAPSSAPPSPDAHLPLQSNGPHSRTKVAKANQ